MKTYQNNNPNTISDIMLSPPKNQEGFPVTGKK